MITLDTSGIIAIANEDDPDHTAVAESLLADPGPWIVPAGVLGEVGYMLESLSSEALSAFLTDLESGAYAYDCGEGDFRRVRILVERYADLPLGFADAAVIACAERHGGRVLTLDRRHFGVVSRAVDITVVPSE